MTKAEILKQTGLTEEEFYKKFPTQESFEKFMKGGKLPKAATGMLLGKAIEKGEQLQALQAAGLTAAAGAIEGATEGKNDPTRMFGATAGGAARGAASGAMFGPVGMGVGALIGGVSGYVKGRQELKAEALEDKRSAFTDKLNEQAENIAKAQVGTDTSGYGVGQMKHGGKVYNLFGAAGSYGSSPFYAYGGMTNPEYEAEGGEILQSSNMSNLYGQGELQKNSSNAVKLNGPSHEEGGMPMSTNGEGRIFSDRLKPKGNKKQTFADLADIYTKEIGKIEETEAKNPGEAAKNTAKYMKKDLNAKLDALFEAQETQKAEKEERKAIREFKKGGWMKYAEGGPVVKSEEEVQAIKDIMIKEGLSPEDYDKYKDSIDQIYSDIKQPGQYDPGFIDRLKIKAAEKYYPNVNEIIQKLDKDTFKKGGLLKYPHGGIHPPFANIYDPTSNPLNLQPMGSEPTENIPDGSIFGGMTDAQYDQYIQDMDNKRQAEITSALQPIVNAQNAVNIPGSGQYSDSLGIAYDPLGDFGINSEMTEDNQLRMKTPFINPQGFEIPKVFPNLNSEVNIPYTDNRIPMEDLLDVPAQTVDPINEIENIPDLEDEDMSGDIENSQLAIDNPGASRSELLQMDAMNNFTDAMSNINMGRSDAETGVAYNPDGSINKGMTAGNKVRKGLGRTNNMTPEQMRLASAAPQLVSNLYRGLFGQVDQPFLGRASAMPGGAQALREAGEYTAYNPAAELAANQAAAGRARAQMGRTGNLAALMQGNIAAGRMEGQGASQILGGAERMNVQAANRAQDRRLGIRQQLMQDAKQTELFNLQQRMREQDMYRQNEAAKDAFLQAGLGQLSQVGSAMAADKMRSKELAALMSKLV